MSIVLRGWSCKRCGVFNGEEKETRETCRSCALPVERDVHRPALGALDAPDAERAVVSGTTDVPVSSDAIPDCPFCDAPLYKHVCTGKPRTGDAPLCGRVDARAPWQPACQRAAGHDGPHQASESEMLMQWPNEPRTETAWDLTAIDVTCPACYAPPGQVCREPYGDPVDAHGLRERTAQDTKAPRRPTDQDLTENERRQLKEIAHSLGPSTPPDALEIDVFLEKLLDRIPGNREHRESIVDSVRRFIARVGQRRERDRPCPCCEAAGDLNVANVKLAKVAEAAADYCVSGGAELLNDLRRALDLPAPCASVEPPMAPEAGLTRVGECTVDKYSSRACERGTKSCITRHPPETDSSSAATPDEHGSAGTGDTAVGAAPGTITTASPGGPGQGDHSWAVDYDALDPGIRETVRWLVANEFYTTDSGDGVSKDPALCDDILDYPHVFMLVDPSDMVHEAHRLRSLVGDMGWIEVTYSPDDKTGILSWTHVNDERSAVLRMAKATADKGQRT